MNNSELNERIGIDRTILCNFQLYNIDSEKLEREIRKNPSNIRVDYDDKSSLILLNGSKIGKLIIEDEAIGKLTIDFKKNNLTNKYICDYRLDLFISGNGNNLQNLNVEEYRYRINEVFTYLLEIYGIYIDYTNIKIKKLEINATFKLNEAFTNYEKALLLIAQNMPSTYYRASINSNSYKYATWYEANKHNNTKKLETIYISNDSVQLKIYNKGKQLSDINKVNEFIDNIIRIEYTFKTKKAVESALGSSYVADLYDDNIIRTFIRYFYRDIVVPYNKWHSDNRKELIKLVKEYKNSYRYWITPFIAYCREYGQNHLLPILFDIDDMKDVFKYLYSKNAYRKYNKFKQQVKKLSVNDLQGNTKKIKEVINKVMAMNIVKEVPRKLPVQEYTPRGGQKNKAV